MSSEAGTGQPPAVSVRGLRKEFACYGSSRDRLVEWLTLGRSRRRQTVVALDDITFRLPAGGALGLVGANGAGKSTLLKILSGTLFQTAGEVSVRGRVASLLELGLGFQPEFTGRRNIVFNARFLGLTHRQIRERVDEIVAFAELEEAIDRPLRTYSSGMQLRLAFAVVASTDPEVLIIDEALAVGDAYFTQKCLARIRRFRGEGTTLLFASHDPAALRSLCDEALLLDRGRALEQGSPAAVLERYNSLIARHAGNRAFLDLEGAGGRWPVPGSGAESPGLHGAADAPADREDESAPRRSGNFRALVSGFSLRDAEDRESRSFVAGEEATIRVEALFLERIEQPTVGILIRDRLGNDVFGTNTFQQRIPTGTFEMGERFEVAFRLPLDLGPGDYTVTVALHTFETHVRDSFDWIDRLVVFRILPPPSTRFVGAAYLKPRISVGRGEPVRQAADWSAALAPLFPEPPPRRIDLSASPRPWLMDGWHPVEPGTDGPFVWSRESCAFVVDLRGRHLELEAGTDSAASDGEVVQTEVWLYDRKVGSYPLDPSVAWSVLRIPIPEELAQPAGLVTLKVPGWRPADRGLGHDRRRLGIRVRRFEVV
jgi:lipopolysaccharide transport system ATP-binding protein